MTTRNYIVSAPGATLVTDVAGVVTLVPGLPSFEETVFSASMAAGLVDDTDAVFALDVVATHLAVLATMVDDSDAVPTATLTLGESASAQSLLPALVSDAETFEGVEAQAWAFVAPDVLAEDDVIDTYPFFIHGVSGGVPYYPNRVVLKGSFPQRRTLTGSMSNQTRPLTGSVKFTATKARRKG